jgi:hypothetical protein
MIECAGRYFRLFVCFFTQTIRRIFGCTASGGICLIDSIRAIVFLGPMAEIK